MHELSICRSLLGHAERVARERGAERVTGIRIRVGPLSGVEPALLRDAWPIASAGSVADEAPLTIVTVPVRVFCDTCSRESAATVNRLLCAHCGEFRTRLVGGDELMLEQVELEVSD